MYAATPLSYLRTSTLGEIARDLLLRTDAFASRVVEIAARTTAEGVWTALRPLYLSALTLLLLST
jgi:hypothetical protein